MYFFWEFKYAADQLLVILKGYTFEHGFMAEVYLLQIHAPYWQICASHPTLYQYPYIMAGYLPIVKTYYLRKLKGGGVGSNRNNKVNSNNIIIV